MPEVARIGGAAAEGSDEEEEEDLHRADPGDVCLRPVEEGDVVALEDAEAVDVAPCVEDDQVGDQHLAPGL